MSDSIRLGSILLHKRAGPLAAFLSFLIRYLDPDPWVRQNWQVWGVFWHTSWVCGAMLDGDWLVRSIEGRGVVYRELGTFDGHYTVVNRLPELTAADCIEFINHHPARGYDGIGYLFTALNRLTRGWFPAVVDRNLFCWEDVSNLCDRFGRPWTAYGEMAYLPNLIKELDA
jgi:hypothetical protein